jgi:ribosomal 30S subunit maturation factor RimM
VERDQLPELAEGEFYLSDALGLPVYRARESGELQALGTVVGISSNGLQDLLEIEWRDPSGRRYEWLVPALPAFIRTLDRDGIVVDVPHGMLPEPLDSGS